MLLLAAVILSACQSDEPEQREGGYGYLQVVLHKAGTRALIEGNPLDHLADAKKIKLSLRYKGQAIEQTLNLYSAGNKGEGNAAADYVLTSEETQLYSGDYQVLGYALYGDYKRGDMAEVLQVVSMDRPLTLTVAGGRLTQQTLDVEATTYGRLSAHIVRLEPETRAAVYSEVFDYDDIDSVQLVLEREVGGIIYREDRKLKAYPGKDVMPTFETDSIDMQTGTYRLSHFELFNRRGQFMYAQDADVRFDVEHLLLSQPVVGVQLPVTQGTLDGIALRQIWDAMDGRHWSFHGQEAPGSNWVFTLADGSPRPLSAWVHQPGVTVNASGRVISLNLGVFNPMGDVPDAIGQLTALERLYLGEHTDEVYYTLEGVDDVHYTISPYLLSKTTDVREHRMEIARERSLLRSLAKESSALMSPRTAQQISQMKFASVSHITGSYDPANRITGISEKIGELTNLTELYIANSLITKLPEAMGKLTNVTDLELYNNPFTELDGDVFKGMQYLTSVNIDRLFNLPEDQLLAALDKMCDYCPKVQLLYLCNLKLTKLPSKLNHLTDLRLLDVSHNKVTHINSLLPLAPVQVILDYNELTHLPFDLFKTDDIESFSCTDNKLQEFPAVLSNQDGLYSFQSVNLSGNRMHGFQEGFRGIRAEKLILSSNHLGKRPGETGRGEMPREFAQTQSVINYLDMAYNNIDTIANAALTGLTSLQALDLSKNELRYLPSGFSSENFPWLTGVDLSHNQLRGFPSGILNVMSLQQLLIRDQGYFRDEAETQWIRTMTQWPDYLHLHPALTNVDMSGNDFRTVTNFPVNLTTLNVTNNPHIQMTVPQSVIYRIKQGLFVLYYDEEQDITAE